ncbi:LysR family transcriptional regulator [Caballeronia sp. ATUFL_M2_KS44]|uniref:LysR family transcriptional regulator n=1 Tax=Caballeronia sp. ATUFL_M2_KS44 TaxID=2921767 RepID=UPI00202966F6|nr:LysR family transcriptional regulator [Caballeronia sp. ATUFL_M2_KS44]
MQINALRYFVHIAMTGSFIATARRFAVPQSTVSRQIAALEESVGQRLLFRHTRAVRLTETGERYYAEVREALDLLDAATEALADGTDAALQGLVRVNAPVALGRLHIAPLLAEFRRMHPKVSVELMLTDAFVDPIQEGADITVRVGRLSDSSLVGRKLGTQTYLLCASPAYLDRHGTPDTPEDLRTHDCLVYHGQHGGQQWFFRRSEETAYRAFQTSGGFRCNNAETLVEAALAGQGIVLFPTWIYQRDTLKRKRLVPLLTGWHASVEPDPPDITLLFPQARLRAKRVQSLADFLVDRIGSPPYRERVL